MNERIRNFIMATLKAMIKEHREESYVREYAFGNYEKNRITENDLFEIEDLIEAEYHAEVINYINDEPIEDDGVEELTEIEEPIEKEVMEDA